MLNDGQHLTMTELFDGEGAKFHDILSKKMCDTYLFWRLMNESHDNIKRELRNLMCILNL